MCIESRLTYCFPCEYTSSVTNIVGNDIVVIRKRIVTVNMIDIENLHLRYPMRVNRF